MDVTPELVVRYVAPSDLKPYERNPRKHPERQIEDIQKSIKRFGFCQPIGVAGDDILTGHGRIEAALRMGLEKIAVIDLSHMNRAEQRAYIIADNKIAEGGRTDMELFKAELKELMTIDVSLMEPIGLAPGELNSYLGLPGEEQDFEPDLEADPITRLGDVWALGKHRLMCGDSTTEDVEVLLDGAKPHLMVTDPPYGVDYDAAWRIRDLGNTGNAIGKVENDDVAGWDAAYRRFPGDVAYVWCPPGTNQLTFGESLIAAGFELRNQIIWVKSSLVIGRGHYHYRHEPCWYAVRGKSHWNGSRKESTVWEIDKPQKSETGHSTQKPIECMQRPIENNSKKGESVYEPFSGSGTTIIAAELSGRVCYAMELHPAYVDIAVKRWENQTGEVAERIIEGEDQPEVSNG